MTAKRRSEILCRRTESLAAYERAMDAMLSTTRYTPEEKSALDEADRHMQEARRLEDEYHQVLPRVEMARCPFDNEPLIRTFDPFGLDGPWWRADASPVETQACRHFCVLVGALDLAGHPPKAGPFEVRPGPQVPFVIPRLLRQEGVTAVLSRIRMENGYVAYPIAYFAERRPPPQDLTASWARTNYLYTTQLGEVAWRVENDRWEFELEPWLSSGKLRWSTGEGESMRLESAKACPYTGLPGDRRPTVLELDQIWFEASPDGGILRPVA